ncbi:MAG: SDR family oxidoreductase [Chitinophagaceae bacterium]|nr:SDR family oxidoreductase [Chitinophagaceae bacterium]
MKVLITGANGFLGHYLVSLLLQKGYEVIATGKGNNRLPFSNSEKFVYTEMDFTNPFVVNDIFDTHKPEIVVHAGAVSKPDECELNQKEALRINTEGTVTMLSNAAKHKCFFIFISTDFVFDGEAGMYTEVDSPNPVNFYGKTKLEAEEAVKRYNFDWAIVRTVLVYGKPMAGRSNILTIVKEKLEKGEAYNVVDDQVRTPTYVEDLAAGIIAIMGKRVCGIYHLSGINILTPYEMACKTADFLGLDKSLIKRVTAESFSQPAKRPARTGFIIDKARRELAYSPVSFLEGLKRTFG